MITQSASLWQTDSIVNGAVASYTSIVIQLKVFWYYLWSLQNLTQKMDTWKSIQKSANREPYARSIIATKLSYAGDFISMCS